NQLRNGGQHLSLRNVSAHPTRDSSRGATQDTGRCEMNVIVNCSRRSFLKSSALAGGGLILGVYVPGLRNSVRAAAQAASTVALNAFVRIAPDDTVTVVVNRSEEHTSELQSRGHLVWRLVLENKNGLFYSSKLFL